MLLIKILQVIIFLFGLYFLFIAAAGLFTKRRCREHPSTLRFAVIVPAHNEEYVVTKLVRNLMDLDYPKELYDVYVIADHCTDDTARAAREQGALVWERSGTERGKGRSLHEVMSGLGFTASGNTAPGTARYDAATIIDADNLVALNYLQVMNSRLLEGEKLIQCLIDAKNPNDSWVASVFSVNFWINNRFILQARYNVGFSSLTAGSGVCISREILEKIGWSTVTITEDLEFAVQALLHGYRATFTRETRVYDEKPLSFSAACRQRLRWARGQLNVALLYAPRLLGKGLLKGDPARLEGGLRLMQLPIVALGTLLALLAPLQPELFRDTSLYYCVGLHYPPVAVLFAAMPYLLPLLALLLDRLPLKPYRYFFLYPFFYISWIGIIIYALFTFRRQKWVPTMHTCNLSLDQLQNNSSHSQSRSPARPWQRLRSRRAGLEKYI
ncbi:MAG: glycosyltransferase family 2 protein [Bacillota bacterium]